MRVAKWKVLFSPSDLNGFLACPHLTTLQVAVARERAQKPYRTTRTLTDPPQGRRARGGLPRFARATDVVADPQALGDRLGRRRRATPSRRCATARPSSTRPTFVDGAWRGLADFVVRQPDGTYEALDTKLARHARPAHVLQLCFYTEQIARIQGSMPRAMHVVTGAGETRDLPARTTTSPSTGGSARASSPPSRAARRPTRTRSSTAGSATSSSLCKEQWERDDHLTLVAGISRTQVERLTAAGITTLEQLGDLAPDTRVKKHAAGDARRAPPPGRAPAPPPPHGEHRVQHLPLEDERGFALMPEPSPGDIWLDLEGHPWYEAARGLEYLFGWVYLEDGEPRYDCIWAGDRAGEKAGFERLVDLIVERRRRFPGMHVYHYAAYERSALSRLMGEHGTRENEIDDLLRGEVLVDLYRVVRQSLRASIPSYSIKVVEELYGFERTADVSRRQRVGRQLRGVARDGRATRCSRRSATTTRRTAARSTSCTCGCSSERPASVPWRAPPEEREVKEETKERLDERDALRERLLAAASRSSSSPTSSSTTAARRSRSGGPTSTT